MGDSLIQLTSFLLRKMVRSHDKPLNRRDHCWKGISPDDLESTGDLRSAYNGISFSFTLRIWDRPVQVPESYTRFTTGRPSLPTPTIPLVLSLSQR